jgi:hypothetical protein
MHASTRRWRRASALATAIPILMILTCATEAAERRICLFDLSILGTGAGVLCEQLPARAGAVDTACRAYVPIRYSRHDTAETIRQAREHNAAWDALCKPKK